MGNYNFKKDLLLSEKAEKLVADYLISKGCTIIEFNKDNRYDILYIEDEVYTSIEVKEDLQYSSTGNVAIELKSRGKASGICASQADKWCYILGNEIWIAKTADVRLFLIQHWDRFRRVNGGDEGTSLVALVRLLDFKEIFNKVE